MALEHVYEVFEKIDKEKDQTKKINLLKEYGAKNPYNLILSLNFDDRIRVDVPEGMPPFKRDESTHEDMFRSSLANEIKRIGSIIKNRTNVKSRMQREYIFIQVLEAIPPKEADVLVFAKDKVLEELYPSITFDLVKSIFPNYCFRENA